MTLKEDIAVDLAANQFDTDEHAEIVIYNRKDAHSTEIAALVTRNNPFQEPYVRGEKNATCEIKVLKTDVTNPQYGDTFTIKNKGWEYDESITIDSAIWEYNSEYGIIEEDTNTLTIGLIRQL